MTFKNVGLLSLLAIGALCMPNQSMGMFDKVKDKFKSLKSYFIQKPDPKTASLKQLLKHYPIHEGVIWDPEKIYEAQEIGYMPVAVRMFKDGKEEVHTIYHGTHVIGFMYPEEKIKKYSFDFLNEDLCKKTTTMLHISNFLYPIIPIKMEAHYHAVSFPDHYKTHSYIGFIEKNDEPSFLLDFGIAISRIMLYKSKYRKYEKTCKKTLDYTQWPKLNTTRENLLVDNAPFALASTIDEAIEIIQKIIPEFVEDSQQILKKELAHLLELKKQPDCDYQWQLARKQDAESLYKKFKDEYHS